MRKLAGFGAFLVLVFFGLAIWLSSDSSTATPEPEGQTADGSHSYSNVRIFEDDLGTFAGTLSVRNHTGIDSFVMVTVNLYDGDQNVARLGGSVSLKPDSESSVDVSDLEPYGPYTEARVHLTAMPE